MDKTKKIFLENIKIDNKIVPRFEEIKIKKKNIILFYTIVASNLLKSGSTVFTLNV